MGMEAILKTNYRRKWSKNRNYSCRVCLDRYAIELFFGYSLVFYDKVGHETLRICGDFSLQGAAVHSYSGRHQIRRPEPGTLV